MTQLEERGIPVRHSVEAVSKLTEVAKDAGVRRLVLLSGRNEVEAEKAERVDADDIADVVVAAL